MHLNLTSKGISIGNKLIFLSILLITYRSVIVITKYLKVSICGLDNVCGKLVGKDAAHHLERDVQKINTQIKVSDTKEHTIKDNKSQDIQFNISNIQKNQTEKAAAAEELYFR